MVLVATVHSAVSTEDGGAAGARGGQQTAGASGSRPERSGQRAVGVAQRGQQQQLMCSYNAHRRGRNAHLLAICTRQCDPNRSTCDGTAASSSHRQEQGGA